MRGIYRPVDRRYLSDSRSCIWAFYQIMSRIMLKFRTIARTGASDIVSQVVTQ